MSPVSQPQAISQPDSKTSRQLVNHRPSANQTARHVASQSTIGYQPTRQQGVQPVSQLQAINQPDSKACSQLVNHRPSTNHTARRVASQSTIGHQTTRQQGVQPVSQPQHIASQSAQAMNQPDSKACSRLVNYGSVSQPWASQAINQPDSKACSQFVNLVPARSSANQTARVPNTNNSPSINSAISIQEVKEALFSVRNNKASVGLAGNPYNILSHCRSDGYTFYIRKRWETASIPSVSKAQL